MGLGEGLRGRWLLRISESVVGWGERRSGIVECKMKERKRVHLCQEYMYICGLVYLTRVVWVGSELSFSGR